LGSFTKKLQIASCAVQKIVPLLTKVTKFLPFFFS
jgi:hypothetical protein